MMNKTLIAAAAAALLSAPAFAAPGGGHGGGASMGAVMGGGHGHAAGSAVTPSVPPVGAGSLNSNGRGTLDRDLGIARATERRSATGALNANNPGSPTRATGQARADDRHELRDLRSGVDSTVNRDQRIEDAYARWLASRR